MLLPNNIAYSTKLNSKSMKKFLLLFFVLMAGIISCQKEIDDNISNGNDGGGGVDTSVNPLKGAWSFDSIGLQSQGSSEVVVLGDTTLTLSALNYTSTNNSGTLTINDSLFNSAGYTYVISATSQAYAYQNGVLINSFAVPFNFYLPPTNSTAKYELAGADSVYFPEGGFLNLDSTTSFKPYGLKFTITDNMLKLTQHIVLDTIVNEAGLSNHYKSTGDGFIYYHKK